MNKHDDDNPGVKMPRSSVARLRPRVALLTNYPYDGATITGGVESATLGLLEGLKAYAGEFDFHVIALARNIGSHREEQRDGMTFHFLAIPSSMFVRPRVIPNIMYARNCVKRLNPDLVHCQDNMALAIGAIMARPAREIFTVHGIKAVESRVWEGPEYWSHQMDALLERWVRKHFDEVITISPYVDRFLPIHVRKHHIKNPVRRLFFEQPQTGRSSRQRILFVGALTRLKRPLDIVQALEIVQRRVPECSVDIVGSEEDTKYLQEINRFIETRRVSGVRFLGKRTQSEVAQLMREACALVLPSVQENTPMVIAEAMASGLPVIASRVGGVPFMVEDGIDGLLYECGNVGELATMITRVLEDEELRVHLSSNGSKKAHAQFSAEAVAAQTAAVYRSLLGVSNG